MALIRMSPIVSAISGNLMGLNFANSRNGTIVRRRLQRTNKATQKQTKVRAAFYRLFNRWRDLTDDNRNSWRATAASLPFANRLGVQRQLTGWQLYLRHNLIREIDASLLPRDDAPLPVALRPPLTVSGSFTVGGPYTLTLTYMGTVTSDDGYYYLDTRPTDRAQRFYNNWKFGGAVSVGFPPGTKDVRGTWITQEEWPELQAGEIVGIKWRSIEAPMLDSPPIYGTATVSA